MPPLTSWKWG